MLVYIVYEEDENANISDILAVFDDEKQANEYSKQASIANKWAYMICVKPMCVGLTGGSR